MKIRRTEISPKSESLQERVERERERHNQGIERTTYNKILLHCSSYSDAEKYLKLREELSFGDGKAVLELGSNQWKSWIERLEVTPATLDCINISEAEIDRGRKRVVASGVSPRFHLMDAHSLEFEPDSFDMVFGGAILHHLDLGTALDQVARVLRPGGRIVFVEPLNINPVSKLVRFLTPNARTVDERPFGFRELAEVQEHFDIRIIPFEFFSVPIGVLSGVVMSKPMNPLTWVGACLDGALQRAIPPARYLYRNMIIAGTLRQ